MLVLYGMEVFYILYKLVIRLFILYVIFIPLATAIFRVHRGQRLGSECILHLYLFCIKKILITCLDKTPIKPNDNKYIIR